MAGIFLQPLAVSTWRVLKYWSLRNWSGVQLSSPHAWSSVRLLSSSWPEDLHFPHQLTITPPTASFERCGKGNSTHECGANWPQRALVPEFTRPSAPQAGGMRRSGAHPARLRIKNDTQRAMSDTVRLFSHPPCENRGDSV